jgi:hypothetical protein
MKPADFRLGLVRCFLNRRFIDLKEAECWENIVKAQAQGWQIWK